MKNHGTVRPATSRQIIDLISALIQAVPRSLSFEQARRWIGKKGDLAENMRFLCAPVVETAKAQSAFKVFKTITIGVHKTAEAYYTAMVNAGFRVGDWARDILNKIQVSQVQDQLDLVVVSVADLGFIEVVSLRRIYAKARKLGLRICPQDVGPALRLDYPDQSTGEWLRIAMKPVLGSDGGLRIFRVVHDDVVRWLDGSCGSPGDLWSPDGRFVFVLPRK